MNKILWKYPLVAVVNNVQELVYVIDWFAAKMVVNNDSFEFDVWGTALVVTIEPLVGVLNSKKNLNPGPLIETSLNFRIKINWNERL